MSACSANLPERLIILTCLLALAGCGGNPPAPPDPANLQHPVEQSARAMLTTRAGPETLAAFGRALKHYEALDDLAGQWRVRMELAKLTITAAPDVALAHARVAASLAAQRENTAEAFRSELLLARLTGEQAFLDEAQQYAVTPGDQAVLAVYLGRVEAAWSALPDVTDPTDRAFILHQYARTTGTAGDYQAALQAYRELGDSRGMADCLVALAHTAADEGNEVQAREYAERALRVLRAIGETEPAGRVNAWLQAQ